MDVKDLRVGDGYEVEWRCRDIGYGVEDGEGIYVYRGLEHGKYAFETPGEIIFLFEDEVVSLSPVEAQLFRVTLDVFVKPKTVTWDRFAFSEHMAASQAILAAEREWPEAALIRCSEVAATIPPAAQRREP